ncbi:MAG: pyruvate kinase [Agathobacter sp.]|nr:pyruvate kinase [Agathobacter sp.]MBQ6812264.1 pyruvate kinase [Agathobacter sp.]
MNTQIFATFGPACGNKEILRKMIDAGMTGMRLNLSHTTLSNSASYINAYREAASEAGVIPQILIDMQGPELRVGDVGEIELEAKKWAVFYPKEMGANQSQENCLGALNEMKPVPVPLAVIKAARVGDEILLDDGKLLVEVIALEAEKLCVKVVRGGILRSHKSIKIKDKNIKLPPLTAHDIENIKCAKEYGVTALMQPFVLDGDDLKYVRSILKEYGIEDIQIFAKIENRLGVENLDSILKEADAIIIARGDLGNDMPLWELPRVQKQIEKACKEKDVPYVVVTQMLSSMETNPVPTRAEVSDIFHAVYHGAWGVMVTGETAVGKYPVEAVCYLANTAQEANIL